MRPAKHFQSCRVATEDQCSCEIRGYSYLASLTLAVSLLEFGVAQYLAKSSSVKVDAMHAGIHSSWYGLAVTVSWLVSRFDFAKNNEARLRAFFGCANFLLLLFSLGMVVWFDAWPKWQTNSPVGPYMMLVGGLIGLSGNWLQLGVLKKIKVVLLQQKGKLHETFEWSKTDVLADLWLSLAVSSAAFYLIASRLAGFGIWFRIDPLLTFIAAAWIAYIAFDLFIRKTAKNI